MTLKICYQNLVDSAVITASSEEASLPAANVTAFHKSKVWRATGCAAEWIKFDLGSPQDITEIIIVGHNFSSGATVQIELNATDAWGAPSVQ
ncbi:MAG: discoidin domain-containing protein, partial [Gammaproteobacteria bacterium]|nr:discoidin domain-containing protein [Gammaproteobacteria bacterium]